MVAKTKNTRFEFGNDKTFSVKYHRSIIYDASQATIPVEFSNGRKYIAYLDTGGPGYAILSSDIVIDNRFPIWPAFYSDGNSSMGICYIPELKVGTAKIENIIAPYDEYQWQFRIIGIPFYKQQTVILGRDFIKSFDYVMFDNVQSKVVFSKEKAFLPDNPQRWSFYPFIEDSNGGNTIVVKIPLAGKVLDIAFDSCWGKPGLFINKKHWEAIKQDLSFKLQGKINGTTYQGMKLPGRKATISSLSIGEKTLKNVEVHISDDPDGYSVIGLDYFQDTIVVLDYVNNLFWIKK